MRFVELAYCTNLPSCNITWSSPQANSTLASASKLFLCCFCIDTYKNAFEMSLLKSKHLCRIRRPFCQFSYAHFYASTRSFFYVVEDRLCKFLFTKLEVRIESNQVDSMFIGPCIIVILEEWKTNLMSLAILFHLLCAQHVSDINISIFRSLRLCWWITTSVVLFCKDGCFSN